MRGLILCVGRYAIGHSVGIKFKRLEAISSNVDLNALHKSGGRETERNGNILKLYVDHQIKNVPKLWNFKFCI